MVDYVFDTTGLLQVYDESANNYSWDAFVKVCHERRLYYAEQCSRELSALSTTTKEKSKVLKGADGFSDGKVNPPTTVRGRARAIRKMSGGSRLDDKDVWTLAIAETYGATLVSERGSREFQRVQKFCNHLNITVISFRDFVAAEGA